MAGARRGVGKRQIDVADFAELIGALSNVRNGPAYHYPRSAAAGFDPNVDVGDPSFNVGELVRQVEKRLDGLRQNDKDWRDRLDRQAEDYRQRLDAERQSATAEAKLLERGRLDALRAGDTTAIANALATAATAAATLQAQVVTSAQVLQSAAAATKDAQDRAIAALQLVQAGAVAVGVKQTEQRQERQFTTSQLVAMGGVVALIMFDLFNRHVI